jgi:hypothetical protein
MPAADRVHHPASGYVNRYGIVLVSNLRDFLILERGPNALPAERESFRLADNEQDFWRRQAPHPRATADAKGKLFVEFVMRACLHAAAINEPRGDARCGSCADLSAKST